MKTVYTNKDVFLLTLRMNIHIHEKASVQSNLMIKKFTIMMVST